MLNLRQAGATRTLQHDLPGLGLGRLPLSARRVLVPASTLLALHRQYRAPQVGPILANAGAPDATAVDDAGAVALLRSRRPADLARRQAPPQRAGVG